MEDDSQTEGMSRKKTLGAGLLAGLVAALLMTLLMMLLRYVFGVPTPSELVGDRLAAALSVETFIKLLTRAGGYNNLKQIGFGSVIAGQLVVGILGGLWYAMIVKRGRARSPERMRRFGTNTGGLLFIIFFTGLLWLASLLLLWPVLGTHYHGLPQGRATIVIAFSWLLSYAVYGIALILGCTVITGPLTLRRVPSTAIAQHAGRRAVLTGSLGVGVAVAVGAIMRRLYGLATFSYDGTQYKGNDVQFLAPNERFYVVTKNVIDPQINRDLWRLEIAGMVDRPRAYNFSELAALPSVTQETTLMCISNEVGGGLMSNAVWKGVPLRALLEAAVPQAGVREVLLHGVDNYSDTFAFEKAMEPETLVVYEMNGAPLPFNHGYPVRVIVPGLYGEKNVKWVTRIELVAHDAKGFYEQQGWGPNFVIPTHSRFDAPDFGKTFQPGAIVPLKGVAFAGNRGISRVEVSIDDGKSWMEAKINTPGTRLTWSLWNYDWQPEQPGQYRLVVRATDGDGTLQTAQERGTVPHGSTGYHKVWARVVA